MSLFVNLKSVGRKDPESNRKSVIQQSETLIEIIRESVEIADVSSDLNIKKARLDFAMKKIIDLLVLANKHPVNGPKNLSSIYSSIRKIRNEIKSLESVTVPFGNREVA